MLWLDSLVNWTWRWYMQWLVETLTDLWQYVKMTEYIYLSMVSTVTSMGGATKPSRNEAYFSINLTVLFLTCWTSPSRPLCLVSFNMSPFESWESTWMPWEDTPSNQQPSSFVLTARDTALCRARRVCVCVCGGGGRHMYCMKTWVRYISKNTLTRQYSWYLITCYNTHILCIIIIGTQPSPIMAYPPTKWKYPCITIMRNINHR